MNIQIFGKNKCFASKAAERFFKERKIKYQFINLADKGLSSRELDNVLECVKDIDLLFDKKSSLYASLNISKLRTIDSKKLIIINNPTVMITPIVRDCDTRQCTLGSCEALWKTWK